MISTKSFNQLSGTRIRLNYSTVSLMCVWIQLLISTETRESVEIFGQPNCLKNRTSLRKKSLISSIPYFSMKIRSGPIPKAKPLNTSGSYPPFSSTFGWTIPAPRISTQPVCLQTEHPEPPPEAIADSLLDWSTTGEQGHLGWSTGYYNYTADYLDGNEQYDVEDFIPFENDGSRVVGPDGANHWDGGQFILYRDPDPPDTYGPWTRVGRTT